MSGCGLRAGGSGRSPHVATGHGGEVIGGWGSTPDGSLEPARPPPTPSHEPVSEPAGDRSRVKKWQVVRHAACAEACHAGARRGASPFLRRRGAQGIL